MATPIINFINYKGGVGKTTLAIDVAAGIAKWGGGGTGSRPKV